jgi:hypothetical protein
MTLTIEAQGYLGVMGLNLHEELGVETLTRPPLGEWLDVKNPSPRLPAGSKVRKILAGNVHYKSEWEIQIPEGVETPAWLA